MATSGKCKVQENTDACAHTKMDNYKDHIRKHRSLFVRELDPDLFLDQLDPFLNNQIHEKMPRAEKVRQLLDNLGKGPLGMYNRFCDVIAGIYPCVFEELKGRPPTGKESDVFFQSFHTELCEGIRNTGSRPDNDIDQKIDLDTQFVSLKLTDRCFDEVLTVTHSRHDEKGYETPDTDDEFDEEQGQLVDLNPAVQQDIEMNDILPKGFTGKSVLLQGRAGVGKSTLGQYMSKKWAEGNWASAFKAVFILNLRRLVHIQQKVTFSELLGMYAEFVVDEPDPQKPSIEWLKHNADKVLIFTDGIDELPELGKLLERTPIYKRLDMHAAPLDWCVNLIKKTVLSACTTIVVSRPFIGLRHLKYDREIEVFGLTKDQIMQFVEKNVGSNRKEVVKQTLLSNPMLLSVCSITFYCAAICKVLEMDDCLDGMSLNTYTRITAYIINRFSSRQAAEECITSVLPEEFGACLSELAALAYRGLLGSGHYISRLVFDQNDFNEVNFTPQKMKMAKQTGLLHFKEVKMPLRSQLQAEFVHLSVQEMLAMLSLESSKPDEIKEFFKSSSGRFNMSKLFAFGIFLDKKSPDMRAIRGKWKTSQMDDISLQTVQEILVEIFGEMCNASEKDDASALQLMRMAYESQQAELAKILSKTIAPGREFFLTHRRVTSIDLKAIFYCLRHCQIQTITCSHIVVDSTLCIEMSKFLEEVRRPVSLTFQGCKILDESVIQLAEGMKSAQCLIQMKFIDNGITDEGMQLFSVGLAESPIVTSLWFLYSRITDNGIQCLANGIQKSCSLRVLKLQHMGVSDQGMQWLVDAINVAKSFKTLHLHAVAISSPALKHAIVPNKGKRKFGLQLELMLIDASFMDLLSCLLRAAHGLTQLRFIDCRLQGKSDVQLSEAAIGEKHPVLTFAIDTMSTDEVSEFSVKIPLSTASVTFYQCLFDKSSLEALAKGCPHGKWTTSR